MKLKNNQFILTKRYTFLSTIYFTTIFFLALIVGYGSLFSQTKAFVVPSSIKRYSPEIIAKLPHNPNYFTQGLKFYQGQLYETTGLYEESKLIRYYPIKKVKSSDGNFYIYQLKEQAGFNFPDRFFAEDLEIVNNEIYVLTWRENAVYIFDKQFKLSKQLSFDREGWGIAFNGKEFITSDGSEVLVFRNPKELRPTRYLTIQFGRRLLKRINAIEWINGYIYANVWFDSNIYLINPKNGLVEGFIECDSLVIDNEIEYERLGLVKHTGNPDNVLNGIAYNPKEETFFITGKRWANIYEIKLK